MQDCFHLLSYLMGKKELTLLQHSAFSCVLWDKMTYSLSPPGWSWQPVGFSPALDTEAPHHSVLPASSCHDWVASISQVLRFVWFLPGPFYYHFHYHIFHSVFLSIPVCILFFYIMSLLILGQFYAMCFNHIHHLFLQDSSPIFSTSCFIKNKDKPPNCIWIAHIVTGMGLFTGVWLTDLRGATSLNKADSPSPRSHHLSVAPQLVTVACGILPVLY